MLRNNERLTPPTKAAHQHLDWSARLSVSLPFGSSERE
jgi:hypothetical protein